MMGDRFAGTTTGQGYVDTTSVSQKRRILVVFGTRPEAIKLAPVILALRNADGCEMRVCTTSQHRQLLDEVLDFFGIVPDIDLDLMRPGQDLTDVTCGVLTGVRKVLRERRPGWVVVQGDTTTAFATALAAFYEGVPVAHVEAGLRTGDVRAPWPEELNRRVTSLVAALHFAPTKEARDNLLREGVAEGAVHVTGNTVIDALPGTVENLRSAHGLAARLEERFSFLDRRRRLVLVTGHRRESFGEGLQRVCSALGRLAERGDVELVYPVHPNPNVQEPVRRILGERQGVHLIEPLDYVSFVYLMDRSHLIITDSGGVQEEAPSLGKPVLVTREATERPEAVAAGTVRLVGTDEERIVAEAARLLDSPEAYSRMARAHNPYGDGKAAERIAKELLHERA